jgi:hypothetical protein
VKKMLCAFVLLAVTCAAPVAKFDGGDPLPTCDPYDPNCKPPKVASTVFVDIHAPGL